jgi:hypothetical protein
VQEIAINACHFCQAGELPPRWAADLGRQLQATLEPQTLHELQDRVVPLGHGVELAHVRTVMTEAPLVGAWRTEGVDSANGATWLRLVVLMPARDPSRHLGWMAHLAAGLHASDKRASLAAAADSTSLAAALSDVLATEPPLRRNTSVQVQAPAATQAAGHRLVVAILKEVEYVDHLLSLFIDHDVRGATVLEARGMAEHLAAHMSLFAGFKSAFKAVGHSQLILTLVPVERTAEVLELVRTAAGGMQIPGSGIAFAVDVPAVVGLGKLEG